MIASNYGESTKGSPLSSELIIFSLAQFAGGVGVPPETFANREVGDRAYRDVFTACLRRNAHPPANPGMDS